MLLDQQAQLNRGPLAGKLSTEQVPPMPFKRCLMFFSLSVSNFIVLLHYCQCPTTIKPIADNQGVSQSHELESAPIFIVNQVYFPPRGD
jgi:hypothetical protein